MSNYIWNRFMFKAFFTNILLNSESKNESKKSKNPFCMALSYKASLIQNQNIFFMIFYLLELYNSFIKITRLIDKK